MNALQLTIGRILLAASHCGQQTFDFIEEDQRSANAAVLRRHSFSTFPDMTCSSQAEFIGRLPVSRTRNMVACFA